MMNYIIDIASALHSILQSIIMDPSENVEMKICPNCDNPFDGIECEFCGFDAYCYDPDYD